MTLGQGQREDHPERVDNIAGHQGTLLCLALWLAPESARDAARARQHITTAAEKHRIGHYMWNVADVHARRLAADAKKL